MILSCSAIPLSLQLARLVQRTPRRAAGIEFACCELMSPKSIAFILLALRFVRLAAEGRFLQYHDVQLGRELRRNRFRPRCAAGKAPRAKNT